MAEKKIDSLDIAEHDGQKYNKVNQIKCDLVLVSGGWSPAVHLLSHRGVRPIWDPVNLCFLPNEIQEPITVTGSAAGIWNTDDCIESGIAAGLKAAQSLGVNTIKYSFPKPGGWKNPIYPSI